MPTRPPPRPTPNAIPLPPAIPGPPTTPAPADRVPDDVASVQLQGAASHQALRDSRAEIARLEAQAAADRERIASLESTLFCSRQEVTRLKAEVRDHASVRAQLEGDVQQERDRKLQAEASMSHLMSSMSKWQKTAVEAQTHIAALEARLRQQQAQPPAPQPTQRAWGDQYQGLGVVEDLLDASGTFCEWASMLAKEERGVAIACYTFDLREVVAGCIGVRRRNLQDP